VYSVNPPRKKLLAPAMLRREAEISPPAAVSATERECFVEVRWVERAVNRGIKLEGGKVDMWGVRGESRPAIGFMGRSQWRARRGIIGLNAEDTRSTSVVSHYTYCRWRYFQKLSTDDCNLRFTIVKGVSLSRF
jgi:hypothetical protein